jgi:hypothetical protein
MQQAHRGHSGAARRRRRTLLLLVGAGCVLGLVGLSVPGGAPAPDAGAEVSPAIGPAMPVETQVEAVEEGSPVPPPESSQEGEGAPPPGSVEEPATAGGTEGAVEVVPYPEPTVKAVSAAEPAPASSPEAPAAAPATDGTAPPATDGTAPPAESPAHDAQPSARRAAALRAYLAERFVFKRWYPALGMVEVSGRSAVVDSALSTGGGSTARQICHAVLSSKRIGKARVLFGQGSDVACR